MLMVVETSVTDFASVAPQNGVRNPEMTAAVPVRVQTVQVLEQDETGWHVRTYRVISLLPPDGGAMHSSI